MNHQEFLDMINRIQKNKAFNNIKVDLVDRCDEVTFDVEYVSMYEMEKVKKTLKLRRIPLTDADGDPVPPILAGKVIATEKIKCPCCGHEEWKNVGKELAIHLLGGIVPGW